MNSDDFAKEVKIICKELYSTRVEFQKRGTPIYTLKGQCVADGTLPEKQSVFIQMYRSLYKIMVSANRVGYIAI